MVVFNDISTFARFANYDDQRARSQTDCQRFFSCVFSVVFFCAMSFAHCALLYARALCGLSSDDSIRSHQHIRWDRQADLFGSFEIHDQLELGWLLHRQVSRFSTFQNLVDVDCGASV